MSGPARQPLPPARPRTKGPVEIAFELALGLFFVTIFSWFLGIAIEIGGIYLLWPDKAERHSRDLVAEDLEYIGAAPRSILIDDTLAFANQVVAWVQEPYVKLGLIAWYQKSHSRGAIAMPTAGTPNRGAIGLLKVSDDFGRELSRWVVISMFVAQDTLLRLAIAVFAAPAFVLACLLGAVDGLVRRDLRRWGGGRESSFVYHHAKRYTLWALTGGFTLYLSWPFGGFNPAYMVLVFTALVAATLSTAIATFKKYV